MTACHQLLDKKRGDLMADVNMKGDNDWTPLHFACISGNFELVNFLIGKEANIDAETTLRFTPLHIAVQRGSEEIAQLLINSGADVDCKDVYSNTPLHYASQNGKAFSCTYIYVNPILIPIWRAQTVLKVLIEMLKASRNRCIDVIYIVSYYNMLKFG